MLPEIIPLESADRYSAGEIGAKAWNLGRLLRHGFPVPPGFCISAEAYARHMLSGDIPDHLKRAVTSAESDRTGDLPQLLAVLRHSIIQAPLPPDLSSGLQQEYQRLAQMPVAVRSSATAEDLAGHSFAGLYESFLGVTSQQELADASKKCWASLWTERAFLYRQRKGFDHNAARMAVIVQTVIPAEVAGVLFTADPASGATDCLLIEAAFGLGEAVVSGKVTPDRYVLAREGLDILERVVSHKKVQVIARHGGVQEIAIDDHKACSPALDESSARELAALGLKIETAFGDVQDIEWAIAAESIYILQARPITSRVEKLPNSSRLRKFALPADRQVWSNLNTGEVLPEVISPLAWSTVQHLLQRVFGDILGRLGLVFDVNQLIGLVAGRVYFNLNAFIGIFCSVPGFKDINTDQMFGGALEKLKKQGFKFQPGDIPNFNFRWRTVLWNLPLFTAWVMSHSTHRGLGVARVMRKHTSRLERVDRAVLPDRELLGLLDFLMSGRHFRGDTLVAGIVGSMCFQRLFTICRDWLGDNDGSLANALLACVGGVNSAESGLDLWRLAIFARSAPNLRNSLLADGNLNATFGKLAGQVGGKEFLARWDAFMAKHGHHARGELDVMIPRWREQPETVLRIVRSYLQDGVPDPLEAYQRRARERCRLEAECRRRLRNPFKRLIFPWVVDQAQRYCRVRENVKSEGVRGLALVRSLFLEIGSRLQNRGMIETTEDIFFLRIEEIEPVFFGKADFDFQAAIAARRHEFEANQTLDPPLLVIGRPDAPLLNPEPVDGTSRMLSGVGVSAGRVQGRARVIVRSDSQEQIMPGEILVAPSTDPGWTPYFLNAAGIVMDLGGLLSHGSIIARECGIPAVVNVGSATRIIRTGQLLHVDGTGGRVHLLD